mmetsp:Transcript_12363/g.17075  ORF Transcript_12363/g.17075 Transcript_12363/m.17075 type:complete len:88 (-) Transcript_12363:29-292(-)
MHKLQQPLIMTSTGSSSHRPLGTGEERGGDRQPPAAVGYGFLEQIFPLSPAADAAVGLILSRLLLYLSSSPFPSKLARSCVRAAPLL